MEFSCVAPTRTRLALPSPSPSPSSSSSFASVYGAWIPARRAWAGWSTIKASAKEPSAGRTTIYERRLITGGGDNLGTVLKLTCGIGVYSAMALAGRFICSITGVDCTGGFDPSTEAVLGGLAYAAPPVMALLFILDNGVVKYSPQARAIRDVEDEELQSFFDGMSPWQVMLIAAASSIGEELFYRVAIQGALTELLLRDAAGLMKYAQGIASPIGVLPVFVPFAQAFAAVVAAVLTGALYYASTAPKDPTYVIGPDLSSGSGHEDMRKQFAAWNEREQMKKIYSPLLEGTISLYLGLEWIKMRNVLAPMITHGIYSTAVIARGLCKKNSRSGDQETKVFNSGE